MEINPIMIILLALLNLLPNSVKQFTLQAPDKQTVTFEKRTDNFWYAPKAQGKTFDGIQIKDGKLMDKLGNVLLNEGDIMNKNAPIRWNSVDLIQEGTSYIKIKRKKKSVEISLGDAGIKHDKEQVFKAKWK